MNKIPKEMKPILNILIHYYRHEYSLTNSRFTAKNFVCDNQGDHICDVSTLSKLENNRSCGLDSTYYGLIHNLNMKLSPNAKLNSLFNGMNHTILKHAEHNYSIKIVRLIEYAKEVANEFANTIYYREYLELYNIIYFYYYDVSFDKDLIDKYLHLYEIIDEDLKPVFLSIAYHYYSRVNINDKVSLDIITRSLDLKTNTIIRSHLINVYYVRTNQPLKIKQQASKNIVYCQKHNNKLYLTKAYNLLAYLYTSSNPNKTMYYLKLYVENFDYENDFNENLVGAYRNMAHIYFSRKEYDEVLNLYNNDLYNNSLFIKAFFMFLIATIKNKSDNIDEIQRIITITTSNIDDLSEFHKTLVKFYESVYFKKSFKEISLFIHELLKLKDSFNDQEILKDILLDEITETCHKHKAYSTYGTVMKHLH